MDTLTLSWRRPLSYRDKRNMDTLTLSWRRPLSHRNQSIERVNTVFKDFKVIESMTRSTSYK